MFQRQRANCALKTMHALIQIFKVNEERSGVKDGRPWSMQDAECALLTDDGVIDRIGVLRVPKDLKGKLSAGIYTASFTLQPNLKSRIIEANVVSLTPVPPKSLPAAHVQLSPTMPSTSPK